MCPAFKSHDPTKFFQRKEQLSGFLLELSLFHEGLSRASNRCSVQCRFVGAGSSMSSGCAEFFYRVFDNSFSKFYCFLDVF